MKMQKTLIAVLFATSLALALQAGLPDGYEPVNCIVSTGRDAGKQWINTKYRPAGTDKIQLKVKFTNVDKTMALYCSRGTSGTDNTFTCFLIKDGTDNKMRLRFDRKSTTANYYSMVMSRGTDYEVTADGNSCNCQVNDGPVEETMATGTFTPGSPLVLFASHTKGTGTITTTDIGNIAEFSLYYFKVTDKDGNVKVDMIPCRETKEGGVAGLYDLQRNAFYPSESTVAFDYVAEPPTAPAAPLVDVKTGKISWTASSGAVAWYLERQIGSGAWTSVYRAESAADCSFVDAPDALNVSYRVAASNAQAVVRSGVVNVRLPIYSIGFGAKSERIRGRFVATKKAFPNSTVLPHGTSVATADVPPEYAGDAAIFTTYAYVGDYGGTTATATFTGLEPNKTYGVRLLSMESFFSSAGQRKADLLVNGTTVLQGLDAYAKAGKAKKPCYWDAEGTATEEGTLRVGVKNTKDDFYLHGIEVYELDDAADMTTPDLTVSATVDYAVIRCDSRTGIGVFEIQMSDTEPGAGASGSVLYPAAPAEVCDLSIARGATRWYRARRKWMGKTSPWSAWQSVTRPANGDFRTVLRLNMDSKNAAVVDGWELDQPYRQAGCSKIDGDPMTTEVVDIPDSLKDPAPAEVYRTRCQSTETTGFKLGWTVSGFEPYAEINVRVHLCEQWTGCSVGSRTFNIKSKYLRQTALTGIDAFKLAGSKALTAVVVEGSLYADGAGQLDLNVDRGNGAPIIRGIELIAANSCPVRLGGAIAESENADGTKSGRGRIYVPYPDTWSLTVAGNGKVSVWMDGQIKGTYTLTEGSPKTFLTGALAEGTYDLHYEFTPANPGATCSFAWSTANGAVGVPLEKSLAVLSNDEPAGTGPWSFAQLGVGQTVPYAEAGSAEFDAFHLSTTGDSMYYAKDDGTYLYRCVQGKTTEFTMTARFTGYACDWTGAQTRIGLGVRDTLENGSKGTYVSYHGFDETSPNRRLTYYCDLDSAGSLNIEGDASKFVTSGWNSLPIWMRVTRTNAADGKHRYVFEYSHNGETWPVARTQEVGRVATSYVGVLAMPSSYSETKPLTVDVDNLTYSERRFGLIIVIE